MRLLRQTFFLTVFMADVKPLGSLRGCRTGRACPESPRLFPHRMPWSPHDGGGGWLPSVASVRGRLPSYIASGRVICFPGGLPRQGLGGCGAGDGPGRCLVSQGRTRLAPQRHRQRSGTLTGVGAAPPPFPSHPAQPIASEVCWLNTCFIKVQSPLQMGVCLEEASF